MTLGYSSFGETHVVGVNRLVVFLKHQIVHVSIEGTAVNEHQGSPIIFIILYRGDFFLSLFLGFGMRDLAHHKASCC